MQAQTTRRSTRSWVLAAAALLSAVVLALAYWNVANLIVLQDHPLPAPAFWPAMWLLLATVVMLLIRPGRRSRTAAVVAFGATGLAVLCGGGATLAVTSVVGGTGRGELVDRDHSDDGKYEVRVLQWKSVLGEKGWDVIIQRRDGLRGVDAYAGCLFTHYSGDYEGIEYVEDGKVGLHTHNGPIAITFDPKTMTVTKRIPADLCQGYE